MKRIQTYKEAVDEKEGHSMFREQLTFIIHQPLHPFRNTGK
jgi:hypothetical protein